MKILLAKLALATALLTGMLAQLHKLQPKHFSDIAGSGITTDTTLTSIQTTETTDLTTTGKYVYIPPTKNADGSIYTVHEFLYPDGTRGYQVITDTITQVLMASGTTAVHKISSVGFGEDALANTWTK